MLKTFFFILKIELILLLRRSQEWLYALSFFLIVMSLFPIAFSPDPLLLQKLIPGCLWIAVLFANLLSIQTIFFTDMEEGCLEQYFLSPFSFTLIIFAKLCAQWFVTSLPLILMTPLLGWLFGLSFSINLILMTTLLLGTPIISLLSSLVVALTMGLRQQGVMLSLIVLPLLTPVLIFGVNIVQQFAAGFLVRGALAFLAGILFLSLTTLPWTIAMTLKLALED